MQRRCLVIALLALAGSAVAQPNPGCDDLSGRPIHIAVDWQAEIKPILNDTLGGLCLNCHVGYPDFSDTDVDAIYKIVKDRVIPGRPEDSRLFLKVNCDAPPTGGARMPLNQPPLSLLQQELIHDWIAQGARGEDPEQPIQRVFVFRDGLEGLR